MDNLLYGHNTEERIVAVQQLNDQTIRLYKRVEGKILQKDVEFFPFFFLTAESFLKDFPKKFWLKKLAGNNAYCFIAAFTRWSEMWEAVHFILRQYNKNHSPRISSYQDLKEILVRADAVRQFFLQSGITLFKKMEYDEIVRLHIDIQCAPAGKKRSGKIEAERILVITLAAQKGTEYILSTRKNDERSVLEQCIQHINTIDPDIIEGYDLFETILPAIGRACERQQMPFAIGRDGSDMRTPSRHGASGFGEGEWYGYDVSGRHLIDLLTLAETEMDVKKAEQSFTLISLAKHFGIPVGTETTIPPQHLAEEWNRRPKIILNQSLRNIQIVRELYDRLAPPLFYLAQMCPFNYRMLIQLSGVSRIEALMLREYVHQKHSVPKSYETSRNINLPAEIYRIGIFSDVLYIKVEGLHSSIIRSKDIKPKTDELNVFLSLLNRLTSLEQEIMEHTKTDQTRQDDLTYQLTAVKHLKDSFHLYLGSAKGLFNDPDNAEVALTASREILKELIHQIEIFNATIIQSDSQGFFLLPPDNIVGETNQNSFVERISTTLPEGIHFELSHRFKGMFSYRKSNYATLDQQMNVLIKGNSLITRNTERYLRVFIQHFIECMLTNDLMRLHHIYATAYTQVIQHKWTPIDFCRTDIAKTDTATYQKEATEGRFVPSPAMEAAVHSSLFVKANAKISYYITGNESDTTLFRSSRLIEEWDPHMPDENTAYYLSRLHETINKFREFFEPSAFERIISMDEMFGFSDEGIRILMRKPIPETAETKSETDDYSIWLAETE
jgi:DNA polymerase I